MAEELECPECHAPLAPDDFQCEQCELLINPQLASGEYVISEPTITRALLSPPMRTSSREMPAIPPRMPVDDAVTVRFAVAIDEHTVPQLSASLDIALRPLHPFEAYVASFIDGVQPVAALARAARLPEIEIKVVLKSLLDRRIVELRQQPESDDGMPLLHGEDFLDEPPPPPPPPPTVPPRVAAARPPVPALPRPFPSQPPAPPRQVGPEDFLQHAVRLEREGQVDRAIEVLKRGLDQVATPAPLYNKLALILLNQRKDASRAAELLERAVELEPRNPVFQQNLLKVVSLTAARF